MAASDRAQRRTAVETELASAEARISQLQRELFDIRQRLNDTTPVLDILPADIMVEIFQHLLPCHPDPELAGYGCLVEPVQLTVGAVCRSWRSIAWDFPGLWKEIRLTVAADRDCMEVQVGLVQEWIHRTGGLPLRISLLVGTTEDDAVLDRILRILLQECRRWKTIELAGNSTHQLRTEMSEGDYVFPMLTSISLGAGSHVVPSPMDQPWTFNTDSSLQYLTVGKGTKWQKEDICVNWATIRHLNFFGGEAAGWAFVSEMAESLFSVQLVSHYDNDDDLPPVRLPSLQELIIGSNEHPEPILDVCLITVMETPALQRLQVSLDPQNTQIPVLSDRLRRSHCSLVDLTLYNLATPMDALVELLQDKFTYVLLQVDRRMCPYR